MTSLRDSNLSAEFSVLWRLAVPVIIAELGWVTMELVDTLMLGRLHPEALGALAVAGSLFLAVTISGIGILLALDTFIAQSYGRGGLSETTRWLVQGTWVALILSIPLTGLLLLVSHLLPAWGTNSAILAMTVDYLQILSLSLPLLLLHTTFRRYLQAVALVRPVMFVLIAANLVNLLANWILIFGNLGVPALGVRGAAWATVMSRLFMAGSLLIVILTFRLEKELRPLGPDWDRILRIFRLGLPASIQLTLEVGLFAGVTAMASWLETASLAAHQIAIRAVAVVFMIPLGISSAGAVRVGHAMGGQNLPSARSSGWLAVLMGAAFAMVASTFFFLVPEQIIRLFIDDPEVLSVGASLLVVAALFQLFDGVQVITTGILRGLGDTKTPMVAALVTHWLLGIPAAYYLCFILDWGVVGLWCGFLVSFTLVSVILIMVWIYRTREDD